MNNIKVILKDYISSYNLPREYSTTLSSLACDCLFNIFILLCISFYTYEFVGLVKTVLAIAFVIVVYLVILSYWSYRPYKRLKNQYPDAGVIDLLKQVKF